MAKSKLLEEPEIPRGARVSVHEQGIEPWFGTVRSLKPSSVSGWWVEVERDGGGTWSICLATTRVEVVTDVDTVVS